MMSAAIALATLMAWSPQFDLVCSGSTRTDGGEPRPTERRIRVDLDAGRWCQEECDRTWPIADAAQDVLVFDQEGQGDSAARRVALHRVSRVTGAWYSSVSTRAPIRMLVVTEGTCEPAAFSGFPQPRF